MADSSKTARFQAQVLPHLNAAFNLACWLTRNPQDAEDVVQEACLRAFKFFDGLHGNDAHAWLLAIVRNTFNTWYRENQVQRKSMPFDEELHCAEAASGALPKQAGDDPESQLLRKDSARLLLQAMRMLPLEFREVMVLRELEELSYKQISEIVGIPVGTVMSRLGRGRKLLARSLAADKPEE
ncbi:sigma-70 family RNA polymerase sigma factor [Herbaspirillum sp. HC18]|nr:sigma-70 family RNA polymerase sigma factor [Herbaspirillum sp. HC18]